MVSKKTKHLRNKGLQRYIRLLPLYGCISTGLIYFGIGTVAILSFLKLKKGGADESSLLAFMNEYVIGKIFIWIILVGTLSYIIWRLYEAMTDPYRYGRTVGGIAKRIGIALSTVADLLIAYAAIGVLLGISNASAEGQPDVERQIVSDLLQSRGGSLWVVAMGTIITFTALVQFFYGITKGYDERLGIGHFRSAFKTMIHLVAWIGYTARGVIIGIIGVFLIKAGALRNAQYVVNTDKAFDFIGDHIGHASFILVAAGTLCYAFFMFTLGITYNADRD
jgi:hypothetical protein